MYFEVENVMGIDGEEEFLTALIHLHSTDDNSCEKLREILDNLIEKKYGQSKTINFRMTKRDSMNLVVISSESYRSNDIMDKKEMKLSNDENERIKTNRYNNNNNNNNSIKKNIKTYNSFATAAAVITTEIDKKIANVFIPIDRMDIPTISIPDENSGSNDDALCKICNGPKLGPLILMECQECQDAYHPLCHQPPVLDLDIYDPRLVWHCAKCVELSEAAVSIVVEAGDIEDKRYEDKKNLSGISIDQIQINKTNDNHHHIYNNHSKEEFNYFRRTESRLNSHIHESLAVSETMDKTGELFTVEKNASLKNTRALAYSSTLSSRLIPHLRKRVGSKLTMRRGNTSK